MMADRVALLNDIEPPPYEHGQASSQENASSTSATQGALGKVGSDQAVGSPPQDQHGYRRQGYPPQSQQGPYLPQSQQGYGPQHGYPPQGHMQPLYPAQQQQPPMTGAVTTQNVMVMQSGCTTVMPAVYPDDNCFYAWFVCLCCFWPLGIAAIIYANRARDAIQRGDYVAAMTHSRDSRRFSYWAIGVHLIGLIIGVPLIIVYVVFAAASTVSSEASNYSD